MSHGSFRNFALSRCTGAIAPLFLAVSWLVSARPAAAELPLKYLPDGSNMLISIRFQDVYDSTFYQNLKKQLSDFSKGEEGFESETGIALDNLARITVAGNIAGKGDEGQPTAVVQTRYPVTADNVRQRMKPRSYQKDFKIEEIKVGEYTILDPSFHLAYDRSAGPAHTFHGQAIVVAESKVVLETRNIDGLRKFLRSGKAAELTATMQNALSNADETKTLVYATDLKAIIADEQFAKDVQRQFVPLLGGAANAEMFKRFDSLTLDGKLSGDDAILRATFVCKDAETASDANKMAVGGQAALRRIVQSAPGAPSEIGEAIGAVKFKVDGPKLQAAGQVKVGAVVAWLHSQIEEERKQAQERSRKQAEEIQRRIKEMQQKANGAQPQGGQP